MKNYVAPGKVLSYSNSSGATIQAGSLLAYGMMLAIATVDIPDGGEGEVAVEGVFEVAKATGTAISVGDSIDFDLSAGNVSTGITAAAGDLEDCAVCVADAASADTTVVIKLLPGCGTVKSA